MAQDAPLHHRGSRPRRGAAASTMVLVAALIAALAALPARADQPPSSGGGRQLVVPTRTPTPISTMTSTHTPIPTATASSTQTPIPTPTATPVPAGFRVDDVSIVEGDSGTRAAVFTVSLDGARSLIARVSVATVNRSARAGSDYVAASARLSFGPLEREKPFAVTILGDVLQEPDEIFTVQLSDASGAEIVDGEGLGTILTDEPPRVGVPELLPADTVTGPGEVTTLTLRWVHPERWRELETVDLRLRDEHGIVFWARFDEAANTLALCDENGACGAGLPPGSDDTIADASATLHLAESAVVGSGATGPSVDLIFAFSLTDATAGRMFQVEAAATDDSGAAQSFTEVGGLEVAAGSGGSDDDGCVVQPPRRGARRVWIAALPLALLGLGRALRRRRTAGPFHGKRPTSSG